VRLRARLGDWRDGDDDERSDAQPRKKKAARSR
jgi:hypothetical protein